MTTDSPSHRVHRFEVVSANELPEMNRLQRSFFSKHYRPGFLRGDAIDVDGQFGYPVVMLHELLAEWDLEPKTAMEGVARIIDAYPKSVAQSEARQCLADMHYLREEWADALKLTYGFRRLVAFVGLSDLLQPRAEAWEIMRWGSSNITKAGWQNLDAALDDLQETLDSFHDAHGISIVGHFWRRLHANETTQAIAQSLYDLIGSDYSVEQIVQLIDHGRAVGPYPLTAFEGFAGYERPIPAAWNRSNPYAFEGVIRALCRPLFRESENRAREAAGLPRVGEGLVSETRLLHQLRAAFPDERIDHQVRPSWLAPQSLDMVLRGRNVAIEYQGAQHSRPVEFFGGREAFERQQQRDATKRCLCAAHGMTLVEVHPDYLLDDIVGKVRHALE
ncbi:hypothetical protein [Curtobacterium sp. VKM Ac-1393]|uniref:hypothetical protein n=1 Tax=Curtobacterium sp. VKM Ac-1393 TaxID=2783814 RepID=UPI00188D64D1|nr:hypothetical protein [Curtobacterium sp. VKM Ac-1393]MBF4606542.1 hypothetical protein [Curtobacterium sp. VKM Ac-1393]